MSNWHDQLGVFDLETTGIDVESARIVSAHVGLLDDDRRGRRTPRLARRPRRRDPGRRPPPSTASPPSTPASSGWPAAQAVAEIVAALRSLFDRGIPVVAYNAPYDFTLLDREAHRHGIAPLVSPGPIIDPLVIDKAVDKYRRGKRTLEVTALHYGVDLTDAHDAGADAIAAGRVAQALARVHTEALALEAAELHRCRSTGARSRPKTSRRTCGASATRCSPPRARGRVR